VAVKGNISPIDIAAAWTSDRKALTIGIVNPTDKKQELSMQFKGVNVADKARQWVITGTDPLAYNEPGKDPNIVIEEKAVVGLTNKLTVPGYSVSIFELVVE
jgi:alpha-N-arabinofuranosidase